MRSHIAFLAAALLAVAPAGSAAHSGLPRASVTQIVAGMQTCRGAITASGFDETTVIAAGWAKGAMHARDGKPIDTPLQVYIDRNGVTLMAVPSRVAGCTVVAGLAPGADWQNLNATMNRTLGAQPVKAKPGEILWLIRPHALQLAATGSRDRPAVRIVVTHAGGEN